MGALVDCGLMPQDPAGRKSLESKDPYELRACALENALEPDELGRALFHLNQRRGFKSNRKMAGDEKEDGQLRVEISGLRGRIEESGAPHAWRVPAPPAQEGQGRSRPPRGRPPRGTRHVRA